MSTPHRVAVVGSGVAGLVAAYVASRSAHVPLDEADDRLGGHGDTRTRTWWTTGTAGWARPSRTFETGGLEVRVWGLYLARPPVRGAVSQQPFGAPRRLPAHRRPARAVVDVAWGAGFVLVALVTALVGTALD